MGNEGRVRDGLVVDSLAGHDHVVRAKQPRTAVREVRDWAPFSKRLDLTCETKRPLFYWGEKNRTMSFFKSAANHFRTQRVLNSSLYGAYRLKNAYQIRRFGILPALHEANVIVSKEQLGIEHSDCSRHVPTSSFRFAAFRTTMHRFVKPNRNDVFMDYGSGLGAAMLMAGTLPFRKIIGVEMSGELNAKAAGIIERYKSRLICQDFRFVTTDATQYDVPAEVTVIYFFNSFWGDVIKGAFAKIRDSLTRHPRRLRIVSHHPNRRDTFIANVNWLTRIGNVTYPFMPDFRFEVFKSNCIE
jgi:hypothetical protein